MIPPGYIVHDDGTIIGLRGWPLKPWLAGKGYHMISACWEGKRYPLYVHQLVCETFHGPRPFPEAQVRHLNGMNTDNRAANLVWGTRAENEADKIRHGTRNQGERQGLSKLTEQQVREIRERYTAGGVFQRGLAAEFGVTQSCIWAIVTRKTWIHI